MALLGIYEELKGHWCRRRSKLERRRNERQMAIPQMLPWRSKRQLRIGSRRLGSKKRWPTVDPLEFVLVRRLRG